MFFSLQVELCKECIEWAKVEKRTFLRQALEVSTPFDHDKHWLFNKLRFATGLQYAGETFAQCYFRGL